MSFSCEILDNLNAESAALEKEMKQLEAAIAEEDSTIKVVDGETSDCMIGRVVTAALGQ